MAEHSPPESSCETQRKPHDAPQASKATAMQRILDSVSRGYEWWTSGTIPKRKLEGFRAKFALRYGTQAEKSERRRRKRNRVGNAVLVIYSPPKSPTAVWWLLCDEDHIAQRIEPLLKATNKHHRLTVPDTRSLPEWKSDYELIRQAECSWTWRITKDCKTQWRDRIRKAVSNPYQPKRDELVRQIVYSIRHIPGFRGIRQDTEELIRILKGDWKRIRAKSDYLPAEPKPPRYVRRRKQR